MPFQGTGKQGGDAEGASRPRLLVISSTFPRWDGDTEPRFVYDLAHHLTADYSVHVLAPHAPGAARVERMGELTVHRFRYFFPKGQTLAYEGGVSARLKEKPGRILLVPFFLMAEWAALMRLLARHRFAAIHAHWLIPQGLVAGLALLGRRKRPALLCTSHGGDLYGLQGRVLAAVKRWVLLRADAVTVVSGAMREKAAALLGGEEQIPVMPMGVDLERTFVPDPSVKRKACQLLFAGRLVEKKGLSYLLESIARLAPEYLELELAIAGSGPEEERLKARAQALGIGRHVRFLGRVSHRHLAQLYREATMAVFPFVVARGGDQEGLGLVVVEAQGCACPVIAGDLPAVRDTITHGKTGLLWEPGNTAALADHIVRLLNDVECRETLAQQGREAAVASFSWPNVAREYARLVGQITSPK